MFFIHIYFLLCHLCLLSSVKSQDKLPNPLLDQVLDFFSHQPKIEDSCYVRQLNGSEDFYIICPTIKSCYIKNLVLKSRPTSLQSTNTEECQPIEDGKPVPMNKVGQLNAVLRVLRSSINEKTLCQHEFRFVESLQVYSIKGLNLSHLGKGNNNCPSTCPYKLKLLSLLNVKIETLSSHSFCQFKQLETLIIVLSNLMLIEEDALAHLVKLKVLVLSSNRVTRLHRNIFRNNVNLEQVDLRMNRIQFLGSRVFYSLSSLKVLFLPNNRLQSLNNSLTFPSNLKLLSIENNEIQMLGSGLMNLGNLTQLHMDNNSVSKVDENAFENLKFVKIFSLAFNKIQQLHKNTFKSNLCLERINLKRNQLSHLPPIGHLTNLKVFLVGGNKISFLGKSDLVNCSQLSYFDLSRNRLSFIEEGAFDNVRQLETLDLSHNRLSQKSSNLKYSYVILKLDLDYNNFTSFSFQDFPPSVKQLSLRFNQIEAIETFNFQEQQLQQRNLTSLNLSNNFLVSIEHLQLPPSTQSVNFSSNRIRKLMSPSDVQLQSLSQLRTVDLRNNNITLLCDNTFNVIMGESEKKTLNVYLSLNPLKCSCDLIWIKDPYGIKFVDLNDIYCKNMIDFEQQPSSNNNNNVLSLKSLDERRFLCLANHTTSSRCECPQQPEMQCEVQSCPYNCTCLSSFNFNLLYFKCNNRQFQQLPVQFLYSHVYDYTVASFDFSMNSIQHLGQAHFGNNLDTKVAEIILDNSNIESIENNAFDRLIHLVSLDLSHNRLQSLPRGLFHRLTEMISLYLMDNRLTHLADDTFNALINLHLLFLNDNGLKRIELTPIVELKLLRNVTLHNNPWSCDCTFIKPFKPFLVDSSTPIHRKLELNCTEEEDKELNIANFNTDHCVPSQTHLSIIIATLTIGLVLILTSLLVFKWRYELQVLVYARYGFRMFHRRIEEVEEKQYDAFVAYNSDDELFLVNELLPGLEAIGNPYRLCIHHRDFPVGAVIQDSILEAIEVSSRTIILLSENFVSSGWCRFEFKSAHMKMLEDKCPRILVILLGKVPKTLEPEMKLYLKTNTYLKWGEKLFWEKMYYAMPDKRVTTPATDIMIMREL